MMLLVAKACLYLNSIILGILKEEWLELERVKNYKGICNVSYQPKNNK